MLREEDSPESALAKLALDAVLAQMLSTEALQEENGLMETIPGFLCIKVYDCRLASTLLTCFRI